MTITAQQEFCVAAHCSHNVLIEIVTGFSERVRYIQSCKPPNEQATRLRLFQMLPDNLLPPAVQAALIPARDSWAKLNLLDTDHEAKRKLLGDGYEAKRKLLVGDHEAKFELLARDYWTKLNFLGDDHWAERQPLAADYWAKGGLLSSAVAANMPALEALHTQLCVGCPWNGKTIFPKEKP